MQGYTPKPIIGGDKNDDSFFRTRDDNIKSAQNVKRSFANSINTRASYASNRTQQTSKSGNGFAKLICFVVIASIAYSMFNSVKDMERKFTEDGEEARSRASEIEISSEDYSRIFSAADMLSRNMDRKVKLGKIANAAEQYAIENGSFPVDTLFWTIKGDFVNRYVSDACPVLSDAQILDYSSQCGEGDMLDKMGNEYKLSFMSDLRDLGGETLEYKNDYSGDILVFANAECGIWGYDVKSAPGGRKMAFILNGENGMSFCETADLDNL